MPEILSTRAKELISIFNEHKLLILKVLFECHGNVCGCDLVGKVGITKDLLSYHIRTLREKGYIEEVKCGRNKKYQIRPNQRKLIADILNLTKLI